LAQYRRVFVMNLNWDDAITQACDAVGTMCVDFDIADSQSDWPDRWDHDGPGLFNAHIHGRLGESCRYGRLETLTFNAGESEHLLRCGLANTMACIGASVTAETDLARLFEQRALRENPIRPDASHWYFVRGDEGVEADDRLRLALTFAPLFNYAKGPDLDFDRVGVLITDAALGVALRV
jgi:hypothetical protein